jgi:hypothetical protein
MDGANNHRATRKEGSPNNAAFALGAASRNLDAAIRYNVNLPRLPPMIWACPRQASKDLQSRRPKKARHKAGFRLPAINAKRPDYSPR